MTSLQEFKDLCLQHGIEQSKVDAFFTTVEKNLKDKRYGLVWEEQMESVAEELKKKFPVLKEVTEREIRLDKDGKTNALIEGDNLESLTFLKNSGKKVDVIYIDPPYNTGNKDFVYNDRFVDKEDSWRHSSWLSFMNKRLVLAREIMSEDGVIFISIDDNEMAQLKLLCDSIFGERNMITTFIWEKNPNPTFLNIFARSSHEYVLCYAKDLKCVSGLYEKHVYIKNDDSQPLQNKSNPVSTLTVGVGESKFSFLNSGFIEKGSYGIVEILDDIEVVDNINVNSFRLSGTFRFRQNYFDDAIKEGRNLVFKTKKMSPRLSNLPKEFDFFAPKSLLNTEATTQIGMNEVNNILGAASFDYPKPSLLIRKLLGFIEIKPNLTILDFFAGSGTTGHAVLELNKEDGGNRQFILCTNNENNIAEEVTYERLKRVMNGYTTPKGKVVEGMPANLKYFKVENIDTDKDIISLEDEIVENIVPFVQFKENLWNTSVDTENNLVYLDNLVTIYTSNYEPPTEEALNSLIVGEKLYIHEGWVDYLDGDIIRKYQIVPIPKEFFNFKTSEVLV